MTDALWTGLGLVAPLNARVSGRLCASVGGISIDTRTLSAGDLYVAIKGDVHDGHDFVARAFEAGASACVIDEAHADSLRGLGTLFIVHDTLSALESLGRAARARTFARIAAVTGSVGKTSTKDALALVLARSGATHSSRASYNNHWGVPLTLARMPQATRFGVFEIGMNHAGEITPLVGMVRPHVALITRIAPVHLEHFESIEAIADAKAEIFSGLVAKGGVAIINRDDEQFDHLHAHAMRSTASFVLTFGAADNADARLLSVEQGATSSHVEAIVLGTPLSFTLGAPGRHHVMNALGVLLAARALGADLAESAAALADFGAPKGRGQRHTLHTDNGAIALIDESYNANPVSMRAALELLAATPVQGTGRRIAVLGDMLELGPQASALHRELAGEIDRLNIDLVFTAGSLMHALFDALPSSRQGAWASDSNALSAAVLQEISAGDVVMIKGSNSIRMALIVDAMRNIFSAHPAGQD